MTFITLIANKQQDQCCKYQALCYLLVLIICIVQFGKGVSPTLQQWFGVFLVYSRGTY